MTIVSLNRADRYDLPQLRQSLLAVLQPLGGMEAFVKPGDRVLLKPNLLTGSRPQGECITRPELVACVAQLVQDTGGQPFLGDSPAFGSARGVAKNNGYLPLCEQYNLPIVEFHGDRYAVESDSFNHLRLSKEAMKADVVINLPKVKSHSQLTMTLGVKNLFGCVPGKMKAWWHLEAGKDANRFGEMLVETANAIQPNLTIVDGIMAHEGMGPSGGEPRFLGLLGASENVFALDMAFLDILKVDPELVPTAAAANRLKIAPHWDTLEFPLLHPRDLQVSDWKLPEALYPIDFGVPRILRSTFKHFYIRFIKEPMEAYSVGERR
ncbi:MAG: DUF362 domain-containing protein [Kamptonema sp. SIO4C4]|nr:DUF362 domain-containing protein [Kamptonema sp. SIO4C4]